MSSLLIPKNSKQNYGESERIRYVEHINKTLENDATSREVIPQLPLDAQSSTQLFEVISEGVLLCKLINHLFPSTILEKNIITKPEKNRFEKTINNELAIEAAKLIGCSVVNIGPSDLTDGTPTLVLGILWQIIKKGLLKSVNLTSNPNLNVLRSESDESIETMAPEQVLLQWFNYQLKKSGYPQKMTNFGSDISDSIGYAFLLRQVAHDIVTPEELETIKNEPDLLKRANMLIEMAKKVLGPEYSMFVNADDIVQGNPRLNLAFIASVFNTHPALGPTDAEIAAVESRFEKITIEKEALESMLEYEQESRIEIQKELEIVRVQLQQSEQEKRQFDQQIQEQVKLNETISQQLSQTEINLVEVNVNIQLKESQIAEFEKKEQQYEEEILQLRKSSEELMQQREKKITELQEEKEKITNQIREMESNYLKEIEVLCTSNKQLQESHSEEITKLKSQHEEEMSTFKKQMDEKVLGLKETIRKLNDLLPDRNVKEGFLTKQSGGNKAWQKRYFVLKTNFICYYKDAKSFKHPQGVIDLYESKLNLVDRELVKKDFVFEVITPHRRYLFKGENAEEIESWMSAIEKAKAKHREEINLKVSFLDLKNKEQ